MFDITKQQTLNKTFRFPLDLIDRLEEVAQAKNVSVSKVVLLACEYALKSLNEREAKFHEVSAQKRF